MSAPFGALPSDWTYWDVVLGVGADLLPVVCQPHLPISPSSKLVTYGKVPSRFDRSQRVVGFPNWTQHQATDAELATWAGDSRLGICLQTRQLRALDVDVSDPGKAGPICQYLDSLFPNLGVRYRRDSSKFLCLFWIEGDYAKQTLRCDGGVIEFLANGQQCLVAGRHPDGAHYQWRARGSFPTLDSLDLEILQEDLRSRFALTGETWSEGRLPKDRDRVNVLGEIHDPVIDYLKALDPLVTPLVRLQADRADVECPWKDQHTAGVDPSSTSFFPAGTGGFEVGHFRCLHAHCEGRTTEEFLGAIGYTLDGFTNIANPLEEQAVRSLIGEDQVGVHETIHPLSQPRFITNDNGIIKVLIKNVVEALRHPDWCQLYLRYDTFRHVIMVGPPESCRPILNTDSTRLNILLAERRFGPGAVSNDMIERAFAFAAHEREFDSAIEWLRGLPPWDGTPRIAQFCHQYLGAEDTPYHQAVSRYWWTAHAGRVLVPTGVQADAAIILVSSQGTGKTTTVKHIVPHPEHRGEVNLSGGRYDIIREMRGRLIIELAELQGLKSRDAESIKALISAMGDTLVDKYEKHAQDLTRRCVFVGSSNNDDFLSDPTGNRRFLPVYVGDSQRLDLILRDRDQLWAEGMNLFELLGEVDWREAQRLVLAEHCKFEEIDVWEEQVFEWLMIPSNWSLTSSGLPYTTCTSVLRSALNMDLQRQSARDMHRVVRIFVRYGLVKRNHRVSGHLSKIWVRKETKHLDSAALIL